MKDSIFNSFLVITFLSVTAHSTEIDHCYDDQSKIQFSEDATRLGSFWDAGTAKGMLSSGLMMTEISNVRQVVVREGDSGNVKLKTCLDESLKKIEELISKLLVGKSSQCRKGLDVLLRSYHHLSGIIAIQEFGKPHGLSNIEITSKTNPQISVEEVQEYLNFVRTECDIRIN